MVGFYFYAVFRTQYRRQKEPSVKTLHSSFSAKFCSIACVMVELNAALCFDIRSKKFKTLNYTCCGHTLFVPLRYDYEVTMINMLKILYYQNYNYWKLHIKMITLRNLPGKYLYRVIKDSNRGVQRCVLRLQTFDQRGL